MASADNASPMLRSYKDSTILGVLISLLILAGLCVVARLYVRLRIVRNAWWDDALILLSLCIQIVGATFVCMGATSGLLGLHFDVLPPVVQRKFMQSYWMACAFYMMATAMVKISLLFQYLRFYRAGRMRQICVGLIVLISIWGLITSTLAWVPCVPISAYWDRRLTNAHCFAFGAKHARGSTVAFGSQAAFNFFWDLCVFATAIPIYARRDLEKKSYLALGVLFTAGPVILALSLWRLAELVNANAAYNPVFDPTWWLPEVILLAVCEVQLGLTVASLPIFWPYLQTSIGSIVITQEVHVTEHRRLGEYTDLDNNSVHSSKGSDIELNRTHSGGAPDYYKDPYIVGQFDPTKQKTNHTTQVLATGSSNERTLSV